jgi:hypothetical protein
MRVRRSQGTDFQIEVKECAGELNRIMPFLLADYCDAAVAAALAIHAVRALARCVRKGDVTHDQARALIERMEKLKLGKGEASRRLPRAL